MVHKTSTGSSILQTAGWFNKTLHHIYTLIPAIYDIAIIFTFKQVGYMVFFFVWFFCHHLILSRWLNFLYFHSMRDNILPRPSCVAFYPFFFLYLKILGKEKFSRNLGEEIETTNPWIYVDDCSTETRFLKNIEKWNTRLW